MPKQFFSVLLLVLSLTGCGFALRGVGQTTPIAPTHQSVQVLSEQTADALALKSRLIKQLQMQGITIANTNNQLTLKNVHHRRYELVGILTEVRLVMTADVEYRIGEKMYLYPIQTEHSYQHNEAGVASDVQGDKAKLWLYDNLSKQIAEQYRALSIAQAH